MNIPLLNRMEFIYVPSLAQLTSVKISLLLMHDIDIAYLLDRDVMSPYQFDFFDRGRHRIWKLLEETVVRKLAYVPHSVSTKVFKILQAMHYQGMIWLRDHDLTPQRKGLSINYRNMCCWNLAGTIDRKKTAMKYVQIESIDSRDRFVMACNYFFRDEIVYLWDIIKIVGINITSRRGSNGAVRLWIDLLRRGCSNPTNQMIEEFFRFERLRETDIPLRISSYFPFLSPKRRLYFYGYFATSRVHEDDFRMCLPYMNETELTHVVQNTPAVVLSSYLAYPFQFLFIDKVDQLRCCMVLSDYIFLLNRMLELFMLGGDIYSQLIKEFWKNTSILYQGGIKRDIKKFKAFEAIFNSKENHSRELEETVAKLYFSH